MKTLIFDLDGTLVDSHLDIVASINHVRAVVYGLPPLEAGFVVDRMNRIGFNLAREFYGVEAYGEEAKELFEEHYAGQCLQNARCYPGIPELLERLVSRSCELFVATNAPAHTSRLILKNNNIDRFFTDIIGADSVEHAKPHPEMIHKIVKRSKFGDVWMVGDSAKDIVAAQKAGVAPIFAKWGYTRAMPEGVSGFAEADSPAGIETIAFQSS
jgi:phosphoglycolate phosphatase